MTLHKLNYHTNLFSNIVCIFVQEVFEESTIQINSFYLFIGWRTNKLCKNIPEITSI